MRNSKNTKIFLFQIHLSDLRRNLLYHMKINITQNSENAGFTHSNINVVTSNLRDYRYHIKMCQSLLMSFKYSNHIYIYTHGPSLMADEYRMILVLNNITFFMHFCPGTMTTQAELINSDLQRGLDRRSRHTTLNREQNQ